MISFKPTDDEIAFVELAKTFADEKLRPNARLVEKEKKVDDLIVKNINELGFTSLELPNLWEGMELPLTSQVQILEALAFGDLAIVQGLPGIGEASSFIRNQPQNPTFTTLKASQQNGHWPTVAFLYDQEAKINIHFDGNRYVLNGCSNPVKMAQTAKFLLIAGNDSNGEPIILFLNENNLVGRKKEGEYRLGLLASGFARLNFENTVIEVDSIVAKGESAKSLLADSLTRIRVIEAAKEVGLMSAALAYVIDYTSSRKAFGQEIAKFQGVSFTAAQMAIHTQSARNLVLYAADRVDKQDEDASLHSLSALNFAHRALRFATDNAVQLLGGHGYVQDHPVEKWMRDAQAQVNMYESEQNLLNQSGEEILSRLKMEVVL